ncbi:hypothetical protein ANCDUO_04733 [Ancylostoma duodenale]|uniref:Uncharacterized protein n=1 Tax=Ancylostoma duodenale TaxID=51022 RepID=A0A0C2H6B0_9BILA|nr:hypothetical protein ANCDUO_04733 [Ancylostoma duodenale]
MRWLAINPATHKNVGKNSPSTSTSAIAKAYDPLKVPEPRKVLFDGWRKPVDEKRSMCQDPDRRIVLHFPDRDERRWISSHKEYAPPCIYERYRLSIEVLPLDDDKEVEEEDDLSWTSGERAERRKSTRRKKAAHSSSVQRVSHIKEDWVDGVDLKLHEI